MTSAYLERPPVSFEEARKARAARYMQEYRAARQRFETCPDVFTACAALDAFANWIRYWPRLTVEDRTTLYDMRRARVIDALARPQQVTA